MSRTFIYGLLAVAGLTLVCFILPNLAESQKTTQCSGTSEILWNIANQEETYRKAEGRYARDLNRLAAHPRTGRKEMLQSLAETGLKGGYRFGTLPAFNASGESDPAKGFAYYAVPETYAVTGRRIYIMDQTGIWYRDTGNATPPAAWPSPNPVAAGWTLLE